MRRSLLGLTFILLTGCSLYQSEGRKFLEKQAFSYASSGAQAYWLGCASENSNGSWTEFEQTSRATLFVSDENNLHVLIVPREQSNFACAYQFPSAEERDAQREGAIEFTFLHLRLGEFAFRPLSHLK